MPKFDQTTKTRLLSAIANNEIDELHALVEEGYPVASYVANENGATALSYAITDDDIDKDDIDLHFQMIKYLIDIGSDLKIREGESRLIHMALRNQSIDPRIVQLLYNYNPEAIDTYAIGLARASSNPALFLNMFGMPEYIETAPGLSSAAAADPLAAAREHFSSSAQTGITAGLDRLTLNLQEITYDQDLTDIFNKLPTLNMDEQKKINQMVFNAENSLLKGLSFAPIAFESVSESSIPLKEAIENFLGIISEFLHSSE